MYVVLVGHRHKLSAELLTLLQPGGVSLLVVFLNMPDPGFMDVAQKDKQKNRDRVDVALRTPTDPGFSGL